MTIPADDSQDASSRIAELERELAGTEIVNDLQAQNIDALSAELDKAEAKLAEAQEALIIGRTNCYLRQEHGGENGVLCPRLEKAEAELAKRDKCSYMGPMRDCPTHGESAELQKLRAELAGVRAGTHVIVPREPVAWLVLHSDGSKDVVLSPLTDETFMDDGDEAIPLYFEQKHVTSATPGGLAGVSSWKAISTAPKDGRLLLLAIDQGDNALEDTAGVSRTIGHNNFDNDGEDVWQFSGWCWEHDHYTDGRGIPVLWRELPSIDDATLAASEKEGK